MMSFLQDVPLRIARAGEESRIYGDRHPYARTGNWREYRLVLGRQRRAPESAAVSRIPTNSSPSTRSLRLSESSIAYPNFLDWQKDNHSFAALSAFRSDDYNMVGAGEPERVHIHMISAEFFPGPWPAAGSRTHISS